MAPAGRGARVRPAWAGRRDATGGWGIALAWDCHPDRREAARRYLIGVGSRLQTVDSRLQTTVQTHTNETFSVIPTEVEGSDWKQVRAPE